MIKTHKFEIKFSSMKNLLFTFLFGILLFFIFPTLVSADEITIYSPTYFNEQNNELEAISYLENELLSFDVCSDNGESFDAKYYCSNNNQSGNISLTKKQDSACFYHNMNFSQIQCDDFELEITFQEDNRQRVVTREFTKSKESVALNKVLQHDILELSPLELSYYLVLHTATKGKNNKQANDIYDLLKQKRDNDKKCWPKNDCDTLTTAKILYNIQLAGYDKQSRLLDDGKVYLESLHLLNNEIDYSNINTYNDAQIDIEFIDDFASNSNECEIYIDGDSEFSPSFTSNTIGDNYILEEFDSSLRFECDEDVNSIKYIVAQEIIDDSETGSGSSISESISSNNKDEYTSFKTKIQLDYNGGGSVSCDISFDDNTNSYTFTDQSSRDDMRFVRTIDDEYDVDCNSSMDYMRGTIYAGGVFEDSFSNTKEETISVDSLWDETFDFGIEFEYDFSKSLLTCDLTVDGGNSQEIIFEEGESLEVEGYSASDSFNFQCDDSLNSIQYFVEDKFGKKQLYNEEFSVSSIDLSIPDDFSDYECLGKRGNCDFDTTMYALMSYNNLERGGQLQSYIDAYKEKQGDFPLMSTADVYEIAGSYLHIKSDQSLKDSLKYLQNNDGSWNKGDKQDRLLSTIWPKLGLEKTGGNAENVLDAQEWIYEEEPQEGWGSIEKNALAYLSIQDQVKPYLVISPFDIISGHKNLTIKNPTIFQLENIKIGFSDSLQDKILYKENLGSLRQDQEISVSLTPEATVQSKISGMMKISGITNGNNREFISIPITIEKALPFSISKSTISFTQGTKEVTIPFSHSSNLNYTYSCDVQSSLFSGKKTIELGSNNSSVVFPNAQELTGKQDMTFECSSQNNPDGILKNTLNFKMIEKSFNVTPESLNISSTDTQTLSIDNFNTQQLISLKLSSSLVTYLNLPKANKMFLANESSEFEITHDGDTFSKLNETLKGEVTITGGKYSKKVDVKISPNAGGIAWIWWILIILVAGFVILVIVRYMQLQNQQNVQNEEQSEDMDEEIEFE